MTKLNEILEWQKNKPKNNKQWADDVKKENLDVKFDYQLKEMEKSHSDKIPKVQKDLDKFDNWSNAVRYELTKQFEQMFKDAKTETTKKLEGKTLQEWIDEEFTSQHFYYKWKKAKLEQSIERIKKERELRTKGFVIANKNDNKESVDVSKFVENKIRHILGTTYYIDLDAGDDAAAGTAIGTAWRTLDKFAENARSAGDIAVVRRGTGGAVASSDLVFVSNGTIGNPIIIEADYDNVWSDRVDLSGTGTATLTFGSKTVTFSADVSGVLSAGDWIYASGDTTRDFAYEVKTVSTVTVTLHLPYKGNQAGSGKTMYNMKAAPIWNTAAGSFQWMFDFDNYWKVQGIHIRGTDAYGQIEIDDADYTEIKDCIFTGNGSGDNAIETSGYNPIIIVDKCRTETNRWFIYIGTVSCGAVVSVSNSFGDFQSYDGDIVSTYSGGRYYIEECEITGTTTSSYLISTSSSSNKISIRNCIYGGSLVALYDATTANEGNVVGIEDYNGTVGDNRYYNVKFAGDVTVRQSETTIVRSGGGNTSIKITPITSLSSNWDFSKLQLFEYPIYADTTSKTYTIYFKTNATADWTADPTNSELWIEAEYWGHASNNHRRITKSTGVIDFNGSTAWQSLTVTVQPSQAGILYLRGWYAKTKETPSNIFYVDVAPVIS